VAAARRARYYAIPSVADILRFGDRVLHVPHRRCWVRRWDCISALTLNAGAVHVVFRVMLEEYQRTRASAAEDAPTEKLPDLFKTKCSREAVLDLRGRVMDLFVLSSPDGFHVRSCARAHGVFVDLFVFRSASESFMHTLARRISAWAMTLSRRRIM
jgi:hypothetical protein